MTRTLWLCLMLAVCFSSLCAQQYTAAASPAGTGAAIPMMVNFTGTLTDSSSKPLTGTVGVTFSLYNDQEGGSPLWLETQNVAPDASGRYSVILGSATSQGLPADLFTSGQARWLGVQAQGQAEQSRVMLLSVPYALKAGDAQTVGGRPASAFALATPNSNSGSTTTSTDVVNSHRIETVGGSGTENFIPMWIDGIGDLGNSAIFQTGTFPAAKIGINTETPATSLDVKGGGTIEGGFSVQGVFSLPAIGGATASRAYNSQPLAQTASAFDSTTKKAMNQAFWWQAEAVGNNTPAPSGTLNLLFAAGTAKPTETGFMISNSGQLTSSVSTGTAPLVVASTTPVSNLTAVPTTYNNNGTQKVGVHIIANGFTFSGGTYTVPLSGASAFSNANSFFCSANDVSAQNPIQIVYNSGESVTFNGTGTDVFRFVCIGN
jgi:hypothetical protein